MQKQLEALQEVSDFLNRHNIRHLVIGGIANAVWGRPRAKITSCIGLLNPRKRWSGQNCYIVTKNRERRLCWIYSWPRLVVENKEFTPKMAAIRPISVAAVLGF
jgi:hypothetical protein